MNPLDFKEFSPLCRSSSELTIFLQELDYTKILKEYSPCAIHNLNSILEARVKFCKIQLLQVKETATSDTPALIKIAEWRDKHTLKQLFPFLI